MYGDIYIYIYIYTHICMYVMLCDVVFCSVLLYVCRMSANVGHVRKRAVLTAQHHIISQVRELHNRKSVSTVRQRECESVRVRVRATTNTHSRRTRG